MKKIVSTLLSLLIFISSYSQKAIEEEMRRLEEKVVQAVLQKDSATLRKIWAPNFMVNAPINRVVTGGQVELVMAGAISYSSYILDIEKILIKGDIVITMGNETVVPVLGNPKGGQTIKRRYTQIWVKKMAGG
ncbi:MAG: nuclear transport factor 2 family protein [Bacteroidota bacterium]